MQKGSSRGSVGANERRYRSSDGHDHRKDDSMTSRAALGLVSPKTRKRVALSWSVLFILSVLLQYAAFVAAPAALAVHNDGLFELDGNATAGAAAGDDWNQVHAGTSSADATKFIVDEVN